MHARTHPPSSLRAPLVREARESRFRITPLNASQKKRSHCSTTRLCVSIYRGRKRKERSPFLGVVYFPSRRKEGENSWLAGLKGGFPASSFDLPPSCDEKILVKKIERSAWHLFTKRGHRRCRALRTLERRGSESKGPRDRMKKKKEVYGHNTWPFN